MQTPRTEFGQALKAIATERGLDAEVILDTIRQAIIAAYRRDAKERGEEVEEESFEFEVELNPSNGEAKVFQWPIDKPEEKKEVTPPGFGRIAAQTAKQVIRQKIREAEKGAIMDEFSGRVGNLISGMILRFEGPDVRVDLGRTEGIMPGTERVPNERLNPNQRYSFLLKEISETPRGKLIILSRSSSEFVSKIFEREVPEIGSGSVVIKGIAREAGVRTKITVQSTQSGVDPVGSCVGQKGVRVQAVTNELGGERIDIISWSESTEELVKASLAPAENLSVALDKKEKIAKVSAPEDQLSMAIGKDGQNARLAAKLTGWKIEIEGDGSGEAVKKEEITDDKKVKIRKEDEEKETVKKDEAKSEKDKVEEVAQTDVDKQEEVKESKEKAGAIAEDKSAESSEEDGEVQETIVKAKE